MLKALQAFRGLWFLGPGFAGTTACFKDPIGFKACQVEMFSELTVALSAFAVF